MKSFFILLVCASLLVQTLQAQQHQYEYQKAYDYAKKLEDKHDYYNAILKYNIANSMEKPESNDIKERISYCADKLNRLRINADSANAAAQEATREMHRLLVRAENMQQKAETAMLDRAIKDHHNDWKGFDKYPKVGTRSDSTQNKILNHIDSLDLSDNALLRIPKEVTKCPNLKYINLFGNTDLDWKASGNTLKQLKNDVDIYVSVNDLSEIDSSYWNLITGVVILPNKLKCIPQNILQQKQLKYLILDENELEFLPAEIGSLTNLIKLSLFRNKIKILPAEIGKLINLSQLVLQGNKLASLPPEIGNLKELTELDLDENSLNSLPVEIGALTKLTKLSLYSNDLSTLPSEIGDLKNLSFLYVQGNKLITLPSEIGGLTNLSTLSLYNNSLHTLPDEIWKLNKLSFLDLGENNLTLLPGKIGNLTNLTTLGLRSAGLKTLPAEIGKLTKLSVLSLEGNLLSRKINKLQLMTNLSTLNIGVDLAELNSEEIANLKKLNSLYLYGNEFSNILNEIKELESLTTLYLIGDTYIPLITIPVEISGLANLTTLYLIGDSLNTIPTEISELANLTKLGLNMRKMSKLPPEIGTLTNLKHLDLVNTQIKSIPPELFNLNLTSEDFFEIAQKLYRAKSYEQALQSYKKCIDIDSTNADAYGNAGLCCRMLGKPENALIYLHKSLSFDENNTWRLNQLSYTYAALNNAAKAFEYAEKSNKIRINANVWFATGNLLSEVKNYEQAINSFLRSIDIDSIKTNASSYSIIASCYGKLGNPRKALNYYNTAYSLAKKLILIDSTNYSNWWDLSFYCLFAGKFTEGIEAAQRSLKLAREMKGVITNLALGYVLNNQFELAKPLYLEWKGKKFPNDNRFANVMFLQDIQDLEDANITHPDFKKVRELFKE